MANCPAKQQVPAELPVSTGSWANVVAGKSNKVIAIEHGLALGTIKSHLSVAYKVLGLNNRTEAVMALSVLALDQNSS